MRLVVINCVLLACTASALADEARPRRHLTQIKEMIANKLFSGDSNSTAPPLQTKFFKIPGFKDVVIKAVPKGSNPEPTPVYEKLPPDSHIGIVSSYLGTKTLNETYNALLGVKNLLTSGILSGKPEVLHEVGLIPSKVQLIAKQPKPCTAPGYGPLPLEPVRVHVKPPRVPVVPTQYSYKQVNQDGSLTTYSSSLDLEIGVRVTEDGKTLPFIIDRVRKIPVNLPVPVLPDVSKIVVPEAVYPAPYPYQSIYQDGRTTSYMGLPPLISQPRPVVVKEMGVRIPAPPVFLMDRIEKVAAIASYPRAPLVAVASKPGTINAGGSVPVLGPIGYSYSQMNVNGGMTTHSAPGVKKASVLVTDNGSPTVPLYLPSLPEKNPFKVPDGYGTYSYREEYGDGKSGFDGLGVPGPVNVVQHTPFSVTPGIPFPPNSFLYKQIGDGKMTTHTGSGTFEENYGIRPTVVVHGMPHPIPPPHITDRIEKVAAGAKYNRPPVTMPIAVPIPTGFVSIPSVHTSHPQRPVKTPSTSGMNSFVYKHVNSDGSATSYGSEGSTVEKGKTLPPPANMEGPFPQGNVRIFESPMYSGPFPMNSVNPNAIKPSTPVSGSYSYKLINNYSQGSHPAVGPIVDTFAPPPPTSMPAPIQGCIDPELSISKPVVIESPTAPVPLTYSYKLISHNNPNPFLVVNVEDPVRGVTNANIGLGENNQAYPSMPPLTPPSGAVQPAPFLSAPIMTPVYHGAMDTAPSSSFSYKQVTNQAYEPQTPPQQSAVNVVEQPQKSNMPMSHAPNESSPPSSFSYKQVTSQAYQPQAPTQRTAVNIAEQSQKSYMPMPQAPNESTPPSSFSYKQVTNQASLPSPQPTINDMERKPSGPPVPPLIINMRVPEIHKANLPSSFSYKQVTSQGVYEYSDEFPTGVKINLPPNASSHPLENPSGHVYVEQKPLPSPTIPTPVPETSTPIPSRPPTLNKKNSLANNPIIVPDPDSGSSFSFKSANVDGSTITVKNDGHNSIAVQVEEAPKRELNQEPTIMASATTNDPSRIEPVLKELTTLALEETGSVSGHTRPMRRRVIKRKKLVKHRGDIPDDE